MNRSLAFIKNNYLLLAIISVGLFLRIYKLGYQSFWLDELHTLRETDPGLSWRELYNYLKCCDQAPPLFFVLEKISLSILGSSEFTARLVSVIGGTVAIWSIFLLGKELLNKNLGLISAALTAVNFYCISYSQEARVYSLAFLFSALSFTFFIRLIKIPTRKNAILYSLFTLALLYTHYYSLFVCVAQALLALIFIFQETGNERKSLFKYFALSAAIIALGYLPLIPLFIGITKVSSSWITLNHNFLSEYFNEYFGNSELLKPLLLLLLFNYFVQVAIRSKNLIGTRLKNDPLSFSFILLFTWFFVTLLIPYLRSILVLPMLYGRYTIVILPALLIAIAYGIELFGKTILQVFITGLLVIVSLIHLFYVKNYYNTASKTQFREMTDFVVSNNSFNFPILNEVTAWQQEYYLQKFHSKAEVLSGKKDVLVDSILQKTSAKYNLKAFWLVGAHQDQPLSNEKRKNLDTAYTLLKQKKFLDAWAQLFVRSDSLHDRFTLVDHNQFKGGDVLQNEMVVAVWNGSVETPPISIKKGKNRITISAYGTRAAHEFPHVNIYYDGKKIGSYYLSKDLVETSFEFETATDELGIFRIEMDNDYTANNEDRNVFIQNLLITHLN